MAIAICVRCGQAKDAHWDACAACDLHPGDEGIEASVQSAYLSMARFDDPARQRAYELELDRLGDRIARGERPEFDPGDLAALRALYTEGVGWTTRDTVGMFAYVGIWLGTPILLAVIATWLLGKC